MARAATFILTLSATQLDVIRDALVLAGAAGRGSFTDAQVWWGNGDGRGNMLRECLGAVTQRMTKLYPRRVQDTPEPAKVAWDLAGVIISVQAARRTHRTPDYASLILHSVERCAHLDCLHSGDCSSQGPLEDLEAIPASPRGTPSPLRPLAAPVPKEHPMSKVVKKPVKPPAKKVVTALIKKAKKV